MVGRVHSYHDLVAVAAVAVAVAVAAAAAAGAGRHRTSLPRRKVGAEGAGNHAGRGGVESYVADIPRFGRYKRTGHRSGLAGIAAHPGRVDSRPVGSGSRIRPAVEAGDLGTRRRPSGFAEVVPAVADLVAVAAVGEVVVAAASVGAVGAVGALLGS